MVPVRKALLIISGNDSESQIPAQRIRRFLLSPMGGGWRPSEITTLLNSSLTALTTSIEKMEADYSLTFFVGPTFADSANNKFLIVNETDYVQLNELISSSKRQLIVTDVITQAAFMPIFSIGSEYERIVSRNLYSQWIERSPAGLVTVQAEPTHSPVDPGFLTQLLLSIDSPLKELRQPIYKSILSAGIDLNRSYKKMGLQPHITFQTQGNPALPFGLVLPFNNGSTYNKPAMSQTTFRKFFGLLFNNEI